MPSQMQTSVQLAVLRSVSSESAVRAVAGADDRDLQRAWHLLIEARAIDYATERTPAGALATREWQLTGVGEHMLRSAR